MKISGSYVLPISQTKAYALVQDPEVLAQCIPGCENLVPAGENSYQMKMKLSMAGFAGVFDGKVSVVARNLNESFRLVVEGSGKIGFVKGEGLLRFVPEDASTSIRYEGDVQVGGAIAGVGQRLLDSTSKLLTRRFFEKLKECVEARG